MKISYNWLKERIPLEMPADELARHLLKIGFEVAEIAHLGPDFKGVVVGEVLKVEKHPDADRLKVCQVSDGEETFSVVCGAPNVAEGQRIPFAKIGARLAGDLKIKKSKIRGAVSHGMICSSKELNLPEKDGADSGILVLPPDSELGADFAQALGEPDAVLDVDITPNRPDCLSHIGLARELAVHFNLAVTPPLPPKGGLPEGGGASFPITIDDAAQCARYHGRIIEGIRVAPSPPWLAERLRAVGLRPINNIVDVTNYVLLETGQPLHAFDADKIDGARIRVRDARPDEKILALDGLEHALTPSDLVIADASRPVAVAGIIGGEETSVTAGTTRIFIECAHFHPGRIRRGAKRLNLRTDSSYRFERGTDIAGIPAAAERAAALIIELAGGRAGAVADTRPAPPAPAGIEISAARINAILGADYPPERITAVLKALSEDMADNGETLTVYPPSHRLDLETAWDLAEEIGRHLGYGAVPNDAGPVRLPKLESLPLSALADSRRELLVGLGFYEAYCYDFLSAAELRRGGGAAEDRPRLRNPISQDWQYLRGALLPGLLRSAALNFNRGADGLRLFELGRVYRQEDGTVAERTHLAGILAGPATSTAHWASTRTEPDFFEVKGVVAALLAGSGAGLRAPDSENGIHHPKACLDIFRGERRVGRFGLLHPTLLKNWDLEGRAVAAFELELDAMADLPAAAAPLDANAVKKAAAAAREPAAAPAMKFKPFSAFPSSSRDISILVDAGVEYARVEQALRDHGGAGLGRIVLIDLFTGEGVPAGRKSLTIRLTFSHPDRTLRDEEIQTHVETLLAALARLLGAELRG
ncbi:MAG: phenylalanine--tRNA ligase subunit beta [Elusimicrobiota bacterium]